MLRIRSIDFGKLRLWEPVPYILFPFILYPSYVSSPFLLYTKPPSPFPQHPYPRPDPIPNLAHSALLHPPHTVPSHVPYSHPNSPFFQHICVVLQISHFHLILLVILIIIIFHSIFFGFSLIRLPFYSIFLILLLYSSFSSIFHFSFLLFY